MQLVLPYNIINNTPADAVQVDTNYDTIAAFVNSQVINRDGGVSMDAPLLLKGNPTAPNHAANKAYIDGFLPVGVIMPFGGAAAPAGDWLLCDGAARSTTTYSELFNVLGYRYGGSGGNFNVPNLKGRFPIGMDASQTEFSVTGKMGGSFTVPVPQHLHAMPHTHEHVHTHTFTDVSTSQSANHTHTFSDTSSAGGAHSHTSAYVGHENLAGGPMLLDRGIGTPGATSLQGVADSTTHTHTVSGTTGSQSANHTHTVSGTTAAPNEPTTSVPSTGNTANAGTAAVEMQPPFTVVNYIIRAA